MLMIGISGSVGYAGPGLGLLLLFPAAQYCIDIAPTAGVAFRRYCYGVRDPIRRVLLFRRPQLLRDTVAVRADVLLV